MSKMSRMMFDTIKEVTDYLAPALAGADPGFDVEGFARQITEPHGVHGRWLMIKPCYDFTDWPEGFDRFWSLVARYDEQAREGGEGQP